MRNDTDVAVGVDEAEAFDCDAYNTGLEVVVEVLRVEGMPAGTGLASAWQAADVE